MPLTFWPGVTTSIPETPPASPIEWPRPTTTGWDTLNLTGETGGGFTLTADTVIVFPAAAIEQQTQFVFNCSGYDVVIDSGHITMADRSLTTDPTPGLPHSGERTKAYGPRFNNFGLLWINQFAVDGIALTEGMKLADPDNPCGIAYLQNVYMGELYGGADTSTYYTGQGWVNTQISHCDGIQIDGNGNSVQQLNMYRCTIGPSHGACVTANGPQSIRESSTFKECVFRGANGTARSTNNSGTGSMFEAGIAPIYRQSTNGNGKITLVSCDFEVPQLHAPWADGVWRAVRGPSTVVGGSATGPDANGWYTATVGGTDSLITGTYRARRTP